MESPETASAGLRRAGPLVFFFFLGLPSSSSSSFSDRFRFSTAAQAIVKDTQCTVNVIHCARIALMARLPFFHFLHIFDLRPSARSTSGTPANVNAKKSTRAFRHILTQDQDKHGANTYVLDEHTVDTFQLQVDEFINVSVIDAATSA
ncbi:hypothetical protein K438DRAFT_1987917 [Mycena galopus ATCC 62051]|nr:hypothetical protein K438DRAFT_1987917 [Mycena galopus ATCC 62051]